jgi:transcriptional regulator with XRE-family HTH domain
MGGTVIRNTLSTNIRFLRNHRKWSQADLAEKAGISTNFLSDIERCRKWPYPETLLNLATALDIEVYELFKPEESSTLAETKDIMARFVKDISAALNQSVNQSVEHVYRQYCQE